MSIPRNTRSPLQSSTSRPIAVTPPRPESPSSADSSSELASVVRNSPTAITIRSASASPASADITANPTISNGTTETNV